MMLFFVVLGFGAKQERNSTRPVPEVLSDPVGQKNPSFCRLKHPTAQKPARQALGAMSKTLALDFGCVLRTTNAFVALGFFPAVLPTQQLLAGGANLFVAPFSRLRHWRDGNVIRNHLAEKLAIR
jgi:hypothetical protein